jgi:hypothetical protein
VSILVVLIGGPQDGQEVHVPDDDSIVTTGVMAVPEFDAPSPADLVADLTVGSTFTLLHYRWDGTMRNDGARRFRLDS